MAWLIHSGFGNTKVIAYDPEYILKLRQGVAVSQSVCVLIEIARSWICILLLQSVGWPIDRDRRNFYQCTSLPSGIQKKLLSSTPI